MLLLFLTLEIVSVIVLVLSDANAITVAGVINCTSGFLKTNQVNHLMMMTRANNIKKGTIVHNGIYFVVSAKRISNDE
jgi:hypothetical protein